MSELERSKEERTWGCKKERKSPKRQHSIAHSNLRDFAAIIEIMRFKSIIAIDLIMLYLAKQPWDT